MDKIISVSEKYSMQLWVPFFLALTLFMLPISSSGKSICFALSLVAILMLPNYRAQLGSVIRTPWCIAAFLLFGVALLACLWSPAPYSERLYVVEKYSKLLYLPILAIGFSNQKVRNLCFNAFLLAMLLTSTIAISKFQGFLPSYNISADEVFRNHIITGFMLAFASYLSILLFYQQPNNKLRFLYLLLTIIYTYHLLFINSGRMGYVIFLVMMLLLVAQLCTWRQAIAGLVIIASVFTFSYFESSVLKTRVNSLVYETGVKNSSVGLRLQFQQFAHQLFNNHPVIGNGSASFTYYFRIINPVPSWARGLWEPHNQYWFVAAEFGVLGLLMLGFFFFTLCKASIHLKTMRPVAVGMLIPFLIGNLSDSLLFYSGSGYFFLLVMAMCLGESIEEKPCVSL